MAAPLQAAVQSMKKVFWDKSGTLINTIRYASKKASGNVKNKAKQTKNKKRGPKKEVGDYVEPGMILYRQLGLKCYPGENVGCGRDNTLYAMEAGRVHVSREKLSPYPYSPLYRAILLGREVHKIFYHILPEEPQSKTFKLVSQT